MPSRPFSPCSLHDPPNLSRFVRLFLSTYNYSLPFMFIPFLLSQQLHTLLLEDSSFTALMQNAPTFLSDFNPIWTFATNIQNRGNPSSGSRADDNTCGQTDVYSEEHDEAKSSCLTAEYVQGVNSTKASGSVPCTEITAHPSATHTKCTNTVKQTLYRSG